MTESRDAVARLFDAYSALSMGQTANNVLAASCILIAMALHRCDREQRLKLLSRISKNILLQLDEMDRQASKREEKSNAAH